MHTPPPPPPTPPGVHRPAPEQSTPKNAENFGKQPQQESVAYPNRPYIPYAEKKVTGDPFWLGHTMAAKHTNRHHARKQAKQRAKRKNR